MVDSSSVTNAGAASITSMLKNGKQAEKLELMRQSLQQDRWSAMTMPTQEEFNTQAVCTRWG